MEIFLISMIFVLGMCCGSFVNMLLYRTAVGYNLTSSRARKPWRSFRDCFAALAMTGRSFCDFCGRQLTWSENIPVVSWIIQKGKSRCCGKKLPTVYPLLELIMGILFCITYYVLRITYIELVISLIIVTFLVFSAAFDIKYMILPDFSTAILIVCGIVLLLIGKSNFWDCFLSGLAAGGFLLVLHLITRGKGMGMGDVKLAIFLGLLLGWQKTIVAFYVAFIVGAIVGLILVTMKKARGKSRIAFGPFLILGILISWWCGDWIFGYALRIMY